MNKVDVKIAIGRIGIRVNFSDAINKLKNGIFDKRFWRINNKDSERLFKDLEYYV